MSRSRPRWASPPSAASLIFVALVAGLAGTPAAAAARVNASFTFTPNAPLSLFPVAFSSTSTASGEGNEIASQAWDLDGNGTFEGPVARTASRSFPRPGTYQVGLRVVDTGGDRSDAVATVKVGNRRPIASIARYPDQPHTGEAVTFFSTSVDQDGSIDKQAWDLDADGKFDDGRTTLVSRSFMAAGVYTVRLRVTDDSGSSHDAAHTFAVTDAAPTGVLGLPGTSPPLRLLTPFPIVRITGNVRRGGTRVRLLTVQAPAQTRVQVACRGRGCPFRSRTRTVGTSRKTAGLVRFRQFRGRLLRPGTRLRVFVSGRVAIGKYTRFRVRRGKPPARADRCLAAGSRAPMRCPG